MLVIVGKSATGGLKRLRSRCTVVECHSPPPVKPQTKRLESLRNAAKLMKANTRDRAVKTMELSVSIPAVLVSKAKEVILADGYPSLSSYIQELIRRDVLMRRKA